MGNLRQELLDRSEALVAMLRESKLEFSVIDPGHLRCKELKTAIVIDQAHEVGVYAAKDEEKARILDVIERFKEKWMRPNLPPSVVGPETLQTDLDLA